MARATHLLHWMLAGCVASCFLSWLAALLPQKTIAIIAFNAIVLVLWVLGWILDDGILKIIRLDGLSYYVALVVWGCSHFIGLGVFLWMYHAN